MVWGMALPTPLIWLVNEGPGRFASKGSAVSMHCFSVQSLAFFAGFGKTRYASTFHAAFVAMVDHSLVANELVSDHQEGLTLRLDITLPSWKHNVYHCCHGSRLSAFMSPTLPRDQIHEWLDSDIIATNSTRVTFGFARQCHYGEFTFLAANSQRLFSSTSRIDGLSFAQNMQM